MGVSGVAKFPGTAGLVAVFVFLFSLPLYAENRIIPRLDAKTVTAGSVVTWEVPLPDVEDPEAVSVLTSPEMEGSVAVSAPVVRRNYIRSGDRSVQEGVIVVCLFRPQRPGIQKISEAVLKIGSRTVFVTARAVEVQAAYRRRSVLPPEIELKPEKTTVYEGETVPVDLILKKRRSLAIPERISVQFSQDGMLEEVEGLCPVQRYSVADILVFDLPLAAYFYTAQSTGRVFLPSVSVEFDDLGTAVTRPVAVEVLPLPEEVRESFAVGDFRFSVVYEKKPLSEGDFLDVALVLEGSGNFNRLQLPPVETVNLEEIDRETEDVWHRSGSRYSGMKRVSYRLMVEKGGDSVSFSVPEWVWFSPEQKTVGRSKAVSVSLNTSAAPSGNLFGQTFAESFPPYTSQQLRAFKSFYLLGEPLVSLLFLPGFLFLLFLLPLTAVRRKQKKKGALFFAVFFLPLLFLSSAAESDTVASSGTAASVPDSRLPERAQEAFEGGRYREAADLWRQWEESDGQQDNAMLCFNRALVCYALKDVSEAVYFIRKAIALKPLNSEYRNFYENLKKEYGLNYSVRPVLKISGTAALITLCIGFNTGALLIFLGVLLRRRDFSVGVMVSFIVILVSGFCLLLYGYDHAVSRNVISVESAALLKIPKTYSADLLAVSEGTVLNVLGESGNFLIVRNDLGITGWIQKTKVRPDF